MLVQYLSMMLVFMTLTLVSTVWPRIGCGLHVNLGLLFLLAFYFRPGHKAVLTLIASPLILIGVLYWFGRPQPRRLAYSLIIGLPILTLIVCGVGPAYRVARRYNDGILRARLVEGNGVRLVWAPEGPGWPQDGVDWREAVRRCQCLTEDGNRLAATAQNVWRLPTVEEAVRSMQRHGKNSGGVWNAQMAKASYQVTPDKESPLWNVHSKVIYWWTSIEVDEKRAFIIVYDGHVSPRRKEMRPGYLGFRCVKSAQGAE